MLKLNKEAYIKFLEKELETKTLQYEQTRLELVKASMWLEEDKIK